LFFQRQESEADFARSLVAASRELRLPSATTMTAKQKLLVNDLLPACLAGSQLAEDRPEMQMQWLKQYTHITTQQDSMTPGPLQPSPAAASSRKGVKRSAPATAPATPSASAPRGSAAAEDGGADAPTDGSTPKRSKASNPRPTRSTPSKYAAAPAPAPAKGAPAKGAASAAHAKASRAAVIPSVPMSSPKPASKKRPAPTSEPAALAETAALHKKHRDQPPDSLHATITLRPFALTALKLEQARTALALQKAQEDSERAAEAQAKRAAFSAFCTSADVLYKDKKVKQNLAWDLLLADGQTWKMVSALGKRIGIVSLFDFVIHTFVASSALTGPRLFLSLLPL